MEKARSSEGSFLTRVAKRHITENGILHSRRCENLQSSLELTCWAMKQRYNMFLVRYVLGFYIPEDDILHSHRRENFKYFIALTG
jgi:hypothetical protein